MTTKLFYLFGESISYSLSPLLHNTGFACLDLPYSYALCDTGNIEVVQAKLQEAAVAGGSVTIPHKQNVMSLVDTLSSAARSIGAVNTIFKV